VIKVFKATDITVWSLYKLKCGMRDGQQMTSSL